MESSRLGRSWNPIPSFLDAATRLIRRCIPRFERTSRPRCGRHLVQHPTPLSGGWGFRLHHGRRCRFRTRRRAGRRSSSDAQVRRSGWCGQALLALRDCGDARDVGGRDPPSSAEVTRSAFSGYSAPAPQAASGRSCRSAPRSCPIWHERSHEGVVTPPRKAAHTHPSRAPPRPGAERPGGGLPPLLFRRHEVEHRAIDAIAESSGWWSVGKDMSQVTTAARAVDFRPRHPIRTIGGRLGGPLYRIEEARPPRAALELAIRHEQRLPRKSGARERPRDVHAATRTCRRVRCRGHAGWCIARASTCAATPHPSSRPRIVFPVAYPLLIQCLALLPARAPQPRRGTPKVARRGRDPTGRQRVARPLRSRDHLHIYGRRMPTTLPERLQEHRLLGAAAGSRKIIEWRGGDVLGSPAILERRRAAGRHGRRIGDRDVGHSPSPAARNDPRVSGHRGHAGARDARPRSSFHLQRSP